MSWNDKFPDLSVPDNWLDCALDWVALYKKKEK